MFWYLFVFSLTLGLDIYTKLIVVDALSIGQAIEVVPNFLNLTLVYNPGAAFGMFGDMPEQARRITLAAVTICAFVVIVRLALCEVKGDRISQTALCGIFAGAIGNVIDRFRYDAVVDFLDVYCGSYHWPAFNIADSAISIGVAIVILRMFILDWTEKQSKVTE
jgi:signal peptidase II